MPVYYDSYTYIQDFRPVDIGRVASFCKSLCALTTDPGSAGVVDNLLNLAPPPVQDSGSHRDVRAHHPFSDPLSLRTYPYLYVYTQDFGPVEIGGAASFCKSLRTLMTKSVRTRSPGRPSSSPVFRSVIFTNITLFIRIHTGLRARGNWRGRELLQQPPHLDDQIRTYTSTHIRI